MQKNISILSILVLFLWGCSSPQANNQARCEHTETSLKCVQYVRNYDGDTVTFNVHDLHPIVGKKISVRVFGIDTPEIRGKKPCEKQQAQKAKALAYQFLKSAKNIELKNITRGKYFRIVAEVWADGKSLAEELSAADLAYAYDGGRKPAQVDWCKAGQANKK